MQCYCIDSNQVYRNRVKYRERRMHMESIAVKNLYKNIRSHSDRKVLPEW